MSWVNVGFAALSVGTKLYGDRKAKKAGQQDAEFDAAQRREAAARSRAMGQRQAIEERREARLLQSALQARAMGGGLDPTIQDLAQDIAGEGEYRALAALYEGDSGALGLESQAAAGLRSAKARGRAINLQSAGTVLQFGSQMYSRYGGGSTSKYDNVGYAPANGAQ